MLGVKSNPLSLLRRCIGCAAPRFPVAGDLMGGVVYFGDLVVRLDLFDAIFKKSLTDA